MLKSLSTAATGMTAQERQLEVISNNLANSATTGFKKSRSEFQDLMYQTHTAPGAATSATTQNPTGIQVGTGAKVVATTKEFEQGSPQVTSRDLDFMVAGDGFFSIQKPNGDVLFTRNGSFKLDNEGRIVTSQGYLLLPEVAVPPGTKSVSISGDGQITAQMATNEVQNIGQVQLTTFINPSGLDSIGESLFAVSPASGEPVPGNPSDPGFGAVQQGMLESSNVSPMEEMTSMIRAQRTYELNSKVIATSDQMLQTLSGLR
jgi:flagellar basal-body rod protein FlgG